MPLQSKFNSCLRAPALMLLLALAGCAGIQKPHRDHLDSADAAIRDCAAWFANLDAAVNRAGVDDIAARRVAGFPYLRIDRFLAARTRETDADAELRGAWLERMLALDAEGRRVEIGNLPAAESR